MYNKVTTAFGRRAGSTFFWYILVLFRNSQVCTFACGMKYRSSTDLVAHVLDAADGGATKTKIMFKAYLGYRQLQEYLTLLVENGLIEYNKQETKYTTTEKGRRFLKLYDRINELQFEETEIGELPRM